MLDGQSSPQQAISATGRRRWKASCCLIAAVICGASDRAWAECGDYLQVGGRAPMSAHGGSTPSSPMPKPCQGPGCRNGAPSSPLPPAAPLNLHRLTDQLLDSNARVRVPESSSISVAVAESTASPHPGNRLPIERPPRSL